MKYKISEVAEIISGGTPKKSEKSYWNGNIPWITIKDFSGKYTETSTDYITDKGLKNSSAHLTNENDILISSRGTVGKILMTKAGYTFNQSIYGLRVNEKIILADFLYYWLKENVEKVKHTVHGSVFDTITRNTFDILTIDVPKLEEQRRIVEKLNLIDSKIIINNKINANLVA